MQTCSVSSVWKKLQICSTLCAFFLLFLPKDGSYLCSSTPEMSSTLMGKDSFPNLDLKAEKLFYFIFSKDFICKCSYPLKHAEKTMNEHCSKTLWQKETRQWQRMERLGFAICVHTNPFKIINLLHSSIIG